MPASKQKDVGTARAISEDEAFHAAINTVEGVIRLYGKDIETVSKVSGVMEDEIVRSLNALGLPELLAEREQRLLEAELHGTEATA